MSYQTFSVEETIENGVKETNPTNFAAVDEAIQNGVKYTKAMKLSINTSVEDTIQNGVKETITDYFSEFVDVEDTIQNGVKHVEDGVKQTKSMLAQNGIRIKETIENGVKETLLWLNTRTTVVEGAIQNGVKEIRSNKGLITSYRQNHKAKETIENGVMNTKPMDEWVNSENIIKYTVEYGVKETHEDVYHHRPRICGVIKNGVKEVQPLPAQDGNRDWGNYYLGKQDRTKPFNDYLNDAIKYGKKI
jgi:hypothetical protein